MFHIVAHIEKPGIFQREYDVLVCQAQLFEKLRVVIPLASAQRDNVRLEDFRFDSGNELFEISIDSQANSLFLQAVNSDRASKYHDYLCYQGEPVLSLAVTPISYRPRFNIITGSPRSGTTAVGRALGHIYGVNAHGESHVSELLGKLCEQSVLFFKSNRAVQVKGTLVNEMSVAQVIAAQCELIRGLHQDYYSDVVIDKTPGIPHMKSLRWLLIAYPQARVVYCARRGLENVSSRLRKFPNVDFEGHCKQWRLAFATFRKVKKDIARILGHSNWYTEIEQFRLLHDPELESRKISDLFDLTEPKRLKMVNYFLSKRPQQTSDSTDALNISSLNWTEPQKEQFIDICGEEMIEQGYSLDNSYFAEEKKG